MGFKRKKLNLRVKRRFQLWLLSRIIGAVLVSSLVAALILYFYAQQEVGESFYEAHIKIRRFSDLLIPVVAAGSLVSLVSGVFLAIFLPQKIAGPIFRMEEDLRKIQGGQHDRLIKLRRGDPLQDFADTINTTVAALRAGKANGEQQE